MMLEELFVKAQLATAAVSLMPAKLVNVTLTRFGGAEYRAESRVEGGQWIATSCRDRLQKVFSPTPEEALLGLISNLKLIAYEKRTELENWSTDHATHLANLRSFLRGD
jgi:hypothetical protein